MALSVLSSPLVGHAQESLTTTQEAPAAGIVHFADGYLTVDVKDVLLSDLLDEIARQSGLLVAQHVALTQRTTLKIERRPLTQAMQQILRHRSFVLEYAPSNAASQQAGIARIKTLRILPQGSEPYVSARRYVVAMQGDVSQPDRAETVATLHAALSSQQHEEREQAAIALGETGHAKAVAALQQALADKYPNVREAAVVALTDIGGTEAAQTLAFALHDDSAKVRQDAIDALGEIGGETAISFLQQALGDPDAGVRAAAAETLERLQGSTRAQTAP